MMEFFLLLGLGVIVAILCDIAKELTKIRVELERRRERSAPLLSEPTSVDSPLQNL